MGEKPISKINSRQGLNYILIKLCTIKGPNMTMFLKNCRWGSRTLTLQLYLNYILKYYMETLLSV